MRIKKQFWRHTNNLFGNPSAQECLGAQVMSIERCSLRTQESVRPKGYRVSHLSHELSRQIDGRPDFITWIDTDRYTCHEGKPKPLNWQD